MVTAEVVGPSACTMLRPLPGNAIAAVNRSSIKHGLIRPPTPSGLGCGHGRYLIKPHRPQVKTKVATPSKLGAATSPDKNAEIEGPSTDLSVIFERLQRVRTTAWSSAAVLGGLPVAAGGKIPHLQQKRYIRRMLYFQDPFSSLNCCLLLNLHCSWYCPTGLNAQMPGGALLGWWASHWPLQGSGKPQTPAYMHCSVASSIKAYDHAGCSMQQSTICPLCCWGGLIAVLS